jgi:DNA gyrase subunit B
VRGVAEEIVFDGALVASADARRLDKWSKDLHAVYGQAATIARGDETRPIRGPSELVDAILGWGQKGLTLQRYKGLGEMNPEQLWETTLDDNARSLLQVRISHGDTADDIFAKLMGDIVDPRREFIQENALAVANLDV